MTDDEYKNIGKYIIRGIDFFAADNITDKLDENGYDRYESAVSMLENAGDDFEVSDFFNILKRT